MKKQDENTTFATKTNNGEMKYLHIIIYIGAAILTLWASSCNGNSGEQDSLSLLEKDHALPSTQTVLSQLKQNADLVTTEVKIRKIVKYDSSKHESISVFNPNTWKYGERKCIVPVEITIEYGYDLRDMTIDNIKLTDDSTAIVIELPKPKVINAGYNMNIDEGSVISISTGLRDKVGHELEEELRRKGYEAVMKEDLSSYVQDDVEKNAKTVFESLVKALGYKDVRIITSADYSKI